jgi:ABC-2 type transport system permease protein
MGHIPAREVLGVLGHQLLWTAVLVVLGRCLLARGTRPLVVQGG